MPAKLWYYSFFKNRNESKPTPNEFDLQWIQLAYALKWLQSYQLNNKLMCEQINNGYEAER